jgi:hypothetical protein
MILCGIDDRPMRLSAPTAVGREARRAGISFGETRAIAAGDQRAVSLRASMRWSGKVHCRSLPATPPPSPPLSRVFPLVSGEWGAYDARPCPAATWAHPLSANRTSTAASRLGFDLADIGGQAGAATHGASTAGRGASAISVPFASYRALISLQLIIGKRTIRSTHGE